MADKIDPGQGRAVRLKYVKADKSVGDVEQPLPLVVFDVEGIGAVTPAIWDAATGMVSFRIDHNGGVGISMAHFDADGDTVPGDANKHPIPWSHEFEFTAPLGATGVSEEIDEQTPTPAP